jgi:hypothetical protein
MFWRKPTLENNMKDPNSVLVLRNGSFGAFEFKLMMGAYGRKSGGDYSIFEKISSVIQEVFRDKPQLLITGNILEEGNSLTWFIRDAREKNPQLVIIYFSDEGGGQENDFDLTVPVLSVKKGDRWEMVNMAMVDFEEGRLRRKVPAPA